MQNEHSNGRGAEARAGRKPGRRAATAEPATPPAFEEALERLDEIVAALEDGQLALDDALALFENGVGLARACQRMLDQAELRIERLRVLASDGAVPDGAAFLVETFDLDES